MIFSPPAPRCSNSSPRCPGTRADFGAPILARSLLAHLRFLPAPRGLGAGEQTRRVAGAHRRLSGGRARASRSSAPRPPHRSRVRPVLQPPRRSRPRGIGCEGGGAGRGRVRARPARSLCGGRAFGRTCGLVEPAKPGRSLRGRTLRPFALGPRALGSRQRRCRRRRRSACASCRRRHARGKRVGARAPRAARHCWR